MDKQKLIECLRNKATITCEALPEETEIKGNCSAISEIEDKQCETWIYSELESGNQWAWYTIKVTATYFDFTGTDYLGCCSYKSKDDFTVEDGYYPDMVNEALSDLADKIINAYSLTNELEQLI